MRRIDRSTYVLSTGRQLDANHGLIGIARQIEPSTYETRAGFEISEGYDGHLWQMGDARESVAPPEQHLTAAECLEVAEFMVVQWQAFADAIRAEEQG